MPYRYLDNIATADAAFEAWGHTVEEMFLAAAEATMNVMVEDLNSISDHQHRKISLEDESLEMLLFQFLQELIYYKDAESLLLRADNVEIKKNVDKFVLNAKTHGEPADSDKHELTVDVKAVTMHRFRVEQTSNGWKATVILDI